jgi:DNA polymerase III delta prime subunit
MNDESLITKYRPSKFSQVVGQDKVVESFRTALDDRSSRQFIFTGSVAGIGKTSLARLGARYVGATDHNITELPAAIYNGVDDMRALTLTLSYRPLGKNAVKALILDEAHRVSAQGWDAILKITEEPPVWAYWFFCTTDVDRIPKTIRSRCSIYTLNPVATNTIFDYLEDVAEAEKFDTPRPILELCAKEADGSLRKALSLLSVCYRSRDRKEAAQLILGEEAKDSGLGFALAQALSKGASWRTVQPILEQLTQPQEGAARETAEGVRHTVRAYFSKVAVNAKDEKVAAAAVRVLDMFSEPCNPADGFSPLVLAVGRVVFARAV